MEQKLTTQDLQIGDYFDYRGKTIKVTSIYAKNGSGEVGFGNKPDCWVHIDVIKPIPITPEILEKNGFEKIEAKYYRYFLEEKDYYESARVYFDEEPNVAVRVLDRSEFKGRIKYVHQLQHALQLCKIRKEIEL